MNLKINLNVMWIWCGNKWHLRELLWYWMRDHLANWSMGSFFLYLKIQHVWANQTAQFQQRLSTINGSDPGAYITSSSTPNTSQYHDMDPCLFSPTTYQTFLVGGWTNPFEKYARQIGSWNPRDPGWIIKNLWVATYQTLGTKTHTKRCFCWPRSLLRCDRWFFFFSIWNHRGLHSAEEDLRLKLVQNHNDSLGQR